jgi:hypothetical protein
MAELHNDKGVISHMGFGVRRASSSKVRAVYITAYELDFDNDRGNQMCLVCITRFDFSGE